MIGVVYLGDSQNSRERLKYVPGQLVRMATTYKDAEKLCRPSAKNEHVILFFERNDRAKDVTAITYLKKNCPNIYVILLTDRMSEEDRLAYQKCGINDTLDKNASVTDLNKKIQFIIDCEDMLFEAVMPKFKILHFKIPVWKRLFDLLFSSVAIVVLSPVFIATAIAIKLESKGPVLFKSKRVGTNYTIFDFLKFRSMYVNADKQLKELSKSQNQYASHSGHEAMKQTLIDDFTDMPDDCAGADMLISDDEVMLVGDDFVVAEGEFNRKKLEEVQNAFVKIENDPRVTKVGAFIRKYSIDELPQLFNILRGDMSIVGNRPLPLYEAERLTADDSIDRFMAPAGLTGLWQVEERGKGGSMSAEERKQLDIRYGQTYNLGLDLKIIFRTLTAFVQKDNV